MKFLCIACDQAMRLSGTAGPDEGSLTVTFACPACGHRVAMLTNPWETQMVRTLGVKVGGAPTFFQATASGGVVSTAAGSFGADFSGASGADALLVLAGPIKGQAKGANVRTVSAGKNTFVVMTLQKGTAPEAKADGDALVVGGQTVTFDGKNVAFATTAPKK